MCQFIALFWTQISFVQVKSKYMKVDMIHFTQFTHPSPTAIIWAMENHTSASSLTEQGRQRDIEREGKRERESVWVCLSVRARAREEGRRAQPAQPTQRDRTTSFRKREERERECVCVREQGRSEKR